VFILVFWWQLRLNKRYPETYKIPYTGGFPIKTHTSDNPPKDGKRLWPPPHAGGRPLHELYDWAFDEMLRLDCSVTQAWKIYIAIYPELDDRDGSTNRYDAFKKAMTYRRSKKNRGEN
jgi:hypothetical protein